MKPPIHALQTTLARTANDQLISTVVNAPFAYRLEMVNMGIGIIVLLLCDPDTKNIHRIALSNTEMAAGTLNISFKRFEDITIPMSNAENVISKAVTTLQPQMTSDWKYLFTPALSPQQARLNQAGGSIACSYVYPLEFGTYAGAMIFSYYKEASAIGETEQDFMKDYSQLVSQRFDVTGLDPQVYTAGT